MIGRLGIVKMILWAVVGVLAVELFLQDSGELLVNEMAPRTHNSGHYSIEACTSSQFDQQLCIAHAVMAGKFLYRLAYCPGIAGLRNESGLRPGNGLAAGDR